ncbi:unnamed protein product [marine sediment metagenome]|uniref:Uncharacterized protein n=1 Tax=marine sediment metagenome TaxID=412755 RepID=X1USJ6_9ZZZZ
MFIALLTITFFFASPLVGYTVGRIVDAVIPVPATETYPLIPDITGFTYTPPTVEVTTPTEPTYPTPPPTLPPIYPYAPVGDVEVQIGATYEAKVMAGKDLSTSIETEYEEEKPWE